jgi:PAS domain-containing protein
MPLGVRLALVVGVTLLYALAFGVLRSLFRFGATPLAVLPVAVAGWLLGLRGGVIAGLSLILLNLALLALTGQSRDEMGVMLIEGGWAGFVALVLMGAVIGWLRDLREQLSRELIERKRAEDALQRERDFAESLIETAQAIILVLDTEGRIVRFNPYLEEISGYDLEEVQGQDWITTFLPQRDHERIRRLSRSGFHGLGNAGATI